MLSGTERKFNRGVSITVLLVVLSGLLLLIILLSNRFVSQNDSPVKQVSLNQTFPPPSLEKPIPANEPAPAASPDNSSETVVCKSQVIRAVNETQIVCYRGNQEIARKVITSDGQTQQSGQIPDGVVKFTDSYNNLSGEDNYLNGKKFGTSKMFYADGVLKTETKYEADNIIWQKDFYHNGTLRFEADYTDAPRDYQIDPEVGVAKLYYPDGKLKYEWNITRTTNPGYKKSYNTDGSLRAVTYFDGEGHQITPQPAQGPTAAVSSK